MKYTITVQNLKCEGCANTIKNKLSKLDSITNVNVDVNNETVSFTGISENDIDKVKNVLNKLGYPQVGANNKLFTKTKSYMSCALGKLSSDS